MDGHRYLDVAQAAEYLSLSTSYLFKLVSRRKVPFIKIGRLVRFDCVSSRENPRKNRPKIPMSARVYFPSAFAA